MTDEQPEFLNEAAVELRVIYPLLLRLGYAPDDIVPKYPIVFQQGRRGRKPEADFVVFSEVPHGRKTSLIVVEAKKPGEPIADAKEQAESYQHAIRAPFSLIVDGSSLEVWQYQPTDESTRVFTIDLKDIEAEYGQLSLILSKAAAVDHSKMLRKPSVAVRIKDWTDYVDAELDRLDAFGPFVERTLFVGQAERQVSSDTILANCPDGAVITGRSGFGKTSLSIDLVRSALHACGPDQAQQIPVHVPLVDLAPGETVFSFILARLSAWKLGFEDAALRQHMKEQGVELFLDEFDRLQISDCQRVETEIRNLKRDYPKNRIFVFSRKAVSPLLDQPQYDLLPLTGEQQYEIVRSRTDPNIRYAWHNAPDLLRELCKVPLLLRLAIEQYERARQWPTKLVEIFEAWLENTVNPDRCTESRRIQREQALRTLASARSDGPITRNAALKVLKANAIGPEVLDELVQCDAISCHQRSVSFSHEALADYIEALELADRPDAEAANLLRNRSLEPESFFPVLLMSVSTSLALHREIWLRLGTYGIETYINVLLYRADLSEVLSTQNPAQFAREFLGDLLDGLEQPLRAFFPQLVQLVNHELTGEDCRAVRILGQATPYHVNYALLPENADSPRVEIGDFTTARRINYVDLVLSRLRPDSGRLIGVKVLRKNIDGVIATQDLAAGPMLANERVLGRLRYLKKEIAPEFSKIATIEEFESLLSLHRGKFVRTSPRIARPNGFLVDDLLADLDVLKQAELPLPTPWWRRDGSDLEPDSDDSEEIAFALDGHYRIAQQVYAEIVGLNFSEVSGSLPFYCTLPVRWIVSVKPSSRGDGWPPYHSYKYLPVADWQAAGADLFPSADDSRTFDPEHGGEVRSALEKLGRLKRNIAVWQGAGSLMHFDGTDSGGDFDGKTSAFRTAFKWLNEDLKSLFSELP